MTNKQLGKAPSSTTVLVAGVAGFIGTHTVL